MVGEGPESAGQVWFLAAGASLGGARRDVAVEGGGVEADPFDAVVAEQLLEVRFHLGVVVEGVVAEACHGVSDATVGNDRTNAASVSTSAGPNDGGSWIDSCSARSPSGAIRSRNWR